MMPTANDAGASIKHAADFSLPTRRAGFTLIEIVIVMLIIMILASVAVSSYTGYIARARRVDARGQLVQVAQFMQTFYAANDSFLQDRTGNSVLDQIPPALAQSPADAVKIYSLLIPVATLADGSFEIRMTPVAGGRMSADQCGAFTLSSTGVRGVVLGEVRGDAALRDMCWQ